MPHYLISFDDGAMDYMTDELLPEVSRAALAVAKEARDAGVWLYSAGVGRQQATVVATDGAVSDGPYPETKAVVGGFSIVDVPSREDALQWAAKFAAACRCAQEVREIMYDPSA